jgi:hypothetical protein
MRAPMRLRRAETHLFKVDVGVSHRFTNILLS